MTMRLNYLLECIVIHKKQNPIIEFELIEQKLHYHNFLICRRKKNFYFVHSGSTGFCATTGVGFHNHFYPSHKELLQQKASTISNLYAISVCEFYSVPSWG